MSNKSTENKIATERGERVRFLRTRIAAMTGEVFAKYCGNLARATITNWEKGHGKFGLTEKGAQLIARGMQEVGIRCSVVWLLHDNGDPPKIVDQNKWARLHYPIPETMQGGQVCEPILYEQESFLEEVSLFKKQYPENLLYTFSDESMAPLYHIHDCVGGPKLLPEQFKLIKNNICIVLLQTEQLVVRCVRLEKPPIQTMSFYVINAETALEHPPISRVPIESILALAPVTRMWRNSAQYLHYE